MGETVKIFNMDGSASDYELLASRLPKFLEVYGPDKGYRVVIEATDYLESRPGLMRLYEAALAGGMKPVDAGLPSIGRGIIFKATLLDKDGNMVLNASALHAINTNKDWECGETAARQRLVAAAGFNGNLIRQDEKADMENQKLETAHETQVPEHEKKPTRRGKRGKGKENTATSLPPAKPEKLAKAGTVPPAMLRQIEHLAKVKGKTVETPNTLDEAKAALKGLLT